MLLLKYFDDEYFMCFANEPMFQDIAIVHMMSSKFRFVSFPSANSAFDATGVTISKANVYESMKYVYNKRECLDLMMFSLNLTLQLFV